MSWLYWGLMLIAQSASFTWVSRARNSGSVLYHGVASVFSNGIFILSLYVMTDKFKQAVTPGQIAAVVSFYVACTVSGAMAMHWFSLTYLEKGKRRVGGA